jgi:hypothetical protein
MRSPIVALLQAGGTHGRLGPRYPQMKRQVEQASDHAGNCGNLGI